MYIGLGADGMPAFTDQQQNVVLLGGPRTGKSSSIVAPAAAVYPGPVIITTSRAGSRYPEAAEVALDSRLRIASRTGARVQEWVLDDAIDTGDAVAVSWDPVRGSAADPAGARRRAVVIARSAILVNGGIENASYFIPLVADVLTAFLIWGDLKNLNGRVVAEAMVSAPIRPTDPKKLSFAHIAAALATDDRFRDARLAFAAVLDDTRTRPDTRRTVLSVLGATVLPLLRDTIRSDLPPLDLDALLHGNGTLIIRAGDVRLQDVAPLIAALLTTVYDAWPRHRTAGDRHRSMLFALDETLKVAQTLDLPRMLQTSGGNGVQILTVVQDPELAETTWGSAASILFSNGTRVLFRGLTHQGFLTQLTYAQGAEVTEFETIVTTEAAVLGPRFAGAERLIAERTAIEATRAGNPGYGGAHALAATLITLWTARRHDNIRSRIEDDSLTSSQQLLAELEACTTIARDRFHVPRLDPATLSAVPEGQVHIVDERGDHSRRSAPHWYESDFWKDLMRGAGT
ncbi:TraM recognition domain-containing protein [Rathayibacter sp. AY1B8]|uniref:TraM recognition domain-containing protein n=1 Tax=Rathayibacter sp. AY1B8 TaxID=2080533 RepID=UPI000CE83810|nr:type IV secretory system conjugative DNA transfer family protein [Rathayibacter sp. AY1B8]PPI05199.1 hypothetical protein C5C63_14620 [Rathayibacter sp. AY1B8]